MFEVGIAALMRTMICYRIKQGFVSVGLKDLKLDRRESVKSARVRVRCANSLQHEKKKRKHKPSSPISDEEGREVAYRFDFSESEWGLTKSSICSTIS